MILKDIENRDWPIPSWFKLPQRIYVHVGKREDDMESVFDFTVGKLKLPAFSILMSYSKMLPRGALIGKIDVVDCVTKSTSPWFAGKYGFILRDPEPIEPLNFRGKLGFFETNI